MSYAWENGSRVPVDEPDFYDDDLDESPSNAGHDSLVMVRRLVGTLLADPNPALGVECMSLATGIGYEGASMADIARRHKVTRASVSKRCIELCEAFGLPPVRAMRSVKNRERCRAARFREIAES
jgi:hypothetical protein